MFSDVEFTNIDCKYTYSNKFNAHKDILSLLQSMFIILNNAQINKNVKTKNDIVVKLAQYYNSNINSVKDISLLHKIEEKDNNLTDFTTHMYNILQNHTDKIKVIDYMQENNQLKFLHSLQDYAQDVSLLFELENKIIMANEDVKLPTFITDNFLYFNTLTIKILHNLLIYL